MRPRIDKEVGLQAHLPSGGKRTSSTTAIDSLLVLVCEVLALKRGHTVLEEQHQSEKKLLDDRRDGIVREKKLIAGRILHQMRRPAS
jgi:hypothetical protein